MAIPNHDDNVFVTFPVELGLKILSYCSPLDLYPAITAIPSLRKAYDLLPFLSIRDLLQKLYDDQEVSLHIPCSSDNPFCYDFFMRNLMGWENLLDEPRHEVEDFVIKHRGRFLITMGVWTVLSKDPPMVRRWLRRVLSTLVEETYYEDVPENMFWFQHGSADIFRLLIPNNHTKTMLKVAMYHRNYATAGSFIVDFAKTWDKPLDIIRCLQSFRYDTLNLVDVTIYDPDDYTAMYNKPERFAEVITAAYESGDIPLDWQHNQVICWLCLDWINSMSLLESALEYLNPTVANCLPIRMAIDGNHIDILKRFVQDSRVNVSDNEQFLVQSAVSSPTAFRFLLSQSNIDPSLSDNQLLMMASKKKVYKSVKILLEHDKWEPGAGRQSAIVQISTLGDNKTLKLLLAHPKLNSVDDINHAVSFAIRTARVHTVKILLADRRVTFDPNVHVAFEDWRYLVVMNSLAMLRFLIYDLGVDVPQHNNVLLLTAVDLSKPSTLKLLLNAPGVDPTQHRIAEETLIQAILSSRVNMLQTLLDDGRIDPSYDDNYPLRFVFDDMYHNVDFYADNLHDLIKRYRSRYLVDRRAAKIGRMLLQDKRVAKKLLEQFPHRTDFFGLSGSVFADSSLDDPELVEAFMCDSSSEPEGESDEESEDFPHFDEHSDLGDEYDFFEFDQGEIVLDFAGASDNENEVGCDDIDE